MDAKIRALLEIKLENSIIIFDEAHNIEDMAREAASGLIRNQTANTGLIGNHSHFVPNGTNPVHSARAPATTRAPADVPLFVTEPHNDMSAHSHREPMQPQTGIGAGVLIQQRINMRSEDPAGLANSRHNPSRVVDDDHPDGQLYCLQYNIIQL